MKKIHLFVVSSSCLLAAWLSASFMTDVQITQSQKSANTPDPRIEEINLTEREPEAPIPVAHFE